MPLWRWAAVAAVFVAGVALSYLLALAGEPQSVWFWTLFGVSP